jgi:hypothetical protein
MTCSDVAELAPLYLSGELDSQSAAEFDAHLKICAACMGELETQAGLDSRLREALLAEEVDASRVNQRVRGLIASETVEALVPALRTKHRRRWVSASMGVAASLILLALGYLLVPGNVARVYADAAADHRDEVVDQQPRRWVTDPAKIAALTESEGISRAVPAALAPVYRLERAKVCWLDGRSFLHLVYSDGTGEFSLYLRARGRLPGAIRGIANGGSLRIPSSGAERLLSFENSRLVAVVVTDQPDDAALRFARAVSAAI